MASEAKSNVQAVDVELIERITLKIASCQEDGDLESAVDKFLPMVLHKLCSPYETVRAKVMELLVHLNKRLKSRPQIKLPFTKLLLLYQDPSASAFLTNFTIIYIKMGFPRMSLDEQIVVAPVILSSLEGKVSNHQDSLLLMLMPLMPHILIPQNTEECSNILGLADKKAVAELFLDFTYYIMLLPYTTSAELTPGQAPPGMSFNTFKRVTSADYSLNSETLEKVKMALVQILGCGCYEADDIVLHLLVASSDSRHSVATAGDFVMKKHQSSIDWNRTTIIAKLYSLFLGTIIPKDISKCSVTPNDRFSPANTRIRLKILPLVTKSVEATKMMIPAIQTIFEALNGPESKPNLKSKALIFVAHFCEQCPDKTFVNVAAVLYNEMKKISLSDETDSSSDFKTEMMIRNLSFSIIPKILRRQKELLRRDLTLVTLLLDFLGNRASDSFLGKDYRLVVRSVLSEIAPILKVIISEDNDAKLFMENVILSYFQKDVNEIKEVVVNLAGEIFQSDHIPSKMIILCALGDRNSEVKKLASDKLDAVKKLSDESGIWPLFSAIMTGHKQEFLKKMPVTVDMISYVHECLRHEITSSLKSDNYFSALQTYLKAAYEKRIDNPSMWQSVINYSNWLESLSFKSSRSQHISSNEVASYLLELYCALSVPAFRIIAKKESLDRISQYVEESPDHVDVLCQISSVILNKMTFSEQEKKELIGKLIEKFENDKSSFENRKYCLLFATYFITDCDDVENFETEISRILIKCLPILESTSSLKLTACQAVGELAKFIHLPSIVDLSKLIDTLSKLISVKEKNLNLNEASVLTLSFLNVGNKQLSEEMQNKILNTLLQESSLVSSVTFHFVLGDALACAIRQSPLDCFLRVATKCSRKIVPTNPEKPKCDHLVKLILEKYVDHTKKSVRSASSVWLLCILRHCGLLLKNSQEILNGVQSALLKLMAFSVKAEDAVQDNDITHDITPKSISLLHDLADSDMKSILERSLETSLAFYEETSSSNVLALRELLICAEKCLGHQKFVYDFLNVVSFRLWGSSAKTREFFPEHFIAQFQGNMEVFLPKLMPYIYVNIHHPNNWVRTYFIALWDSLVPSGQRLVILNKHLKGILITIFDTLQDSSWTLREAGCATISNLMQIGSHSFKPFIQETSELFEHCFRVCDDMKETVRNRAEAALKSLLKVAVDLCDSNNYGVQSCQTSIAQILPILVKVGLTYPIEGVRLLCLNAVIKIADFGGSCIKPHLPVLVPSFLDALTSLESQAVNYLSNRIADDKDMHGQLDSIRLNNIQSSPVMRALKKSVQYIDSNVMDELAPHLIEVTRSSVAFSSKVGVCLFLIQLVDQCPTETKPYCNKLLSALTKSMRNRNRAIQKCCADALGHVIRLAPDKNITSFLNSRESEYFGEDKSDRCLVASVFKTIAKNSSDVVKNHASKILPLAFFAMHEPEPELEEDPSDEICVTKKIFEELWSEFTPGTENGIKLYSKEIITLINDKGFKSQAWTDKHQAALCLQTYLKEIGSSLDKNLCLEIFSTLNENLFGRTWKGTVILLNFAHAIMTISFKESILICLKMLLINSKSVFVEMEEANEFSWKKIPSILMKECRKENFSYKKVSIQVTSEIISTFDENQFEEFYLTFLEPLFSLDAKTSEEEKYSEQQILEMKIVSLTALSNSWPKVNAEIQKKHSNNVFNVLAKLYRENDYKIKVKVLLTSVSLAEKFVPIVFDNISFMSDFLMILHDALATNRYPDLQSHSLDFLDSLPLHGEGTRLQSLVSSEMRLSINKIAEENKNGLLKDKAQLILKKISC